MIRCIIVDDEPLAVAQLEKYVERVPFLVNVGSCSSAAEAMEILSDGNVDAMFVDINMPDIDGVQLVRSLARPPMVVFTTAYSEYAIEGFRLDAIDYLLKPFGFDELLRSAGKAQSLFELHNLRLQTETATAMDEGEGAEPASDGVDESNDKEYISIRADHKTSLVKLANIVYLESEGEYVRMHLNDGTKIVTLFRSDSRWHRA